MIRILLNLSLFTFINLLMHVNAIARDDMPGAADHPKLPRVAGSTIVAYMSTDYGEHDFLKGYKKKNKELVISSKEGKLTQLVYALEKNQSAVFASRNYQEAFSELGKVKVIYSCKKAECPPTLGNKFVWSKDKQFNSNIKTLRHMYSITAYHNNLRYWFAEIESETAKYAVSFYAGEAKTISNSHKKEGFDVGQVFAHITIVEKSDFKSDLAVVEASEIQSAIADKGHIALYGLFFDTGKDQLAKESEPALTEIAKALKAEKNLKVYVVGHTDNVGSLATNQKLSERRAVSIINSLITEFGIAKSRMVPVGVGLAAPVSTNDTEQGRSLNRRVELVKQ